MASITLTGSLLDPNGFVSIGDQVRFTHKSNTGSTIKSAVSVITIPPSGNYNITLQYGLVRVEYKDILTGAYKDVGVVTVNQDNPATTLPELLSAAVPPSSQEMIEFQAILADCVQEASNAAQSATEAEQAVTDIEALTGQQTTTELINSSTAYDADKVLETSGFTTAGDGGGGKWKQNGVTGQTPSQTPAQLGGAVLNDAAGNQWGLVVDKFLNVKSLGARGDGSADDAQSIQASVYSASLQGGGNVFIPSGIYLLSASITIASKVKLRGENWEATSLKANGDFPVIMYYGQISSQLARSVISDIKIIGGGKDNTSAHGISLKWANKPLIERVQFRSCRNCVDVQYCIDLTLSHVFAEGQSLDQNYWGLYLHEIDSSLGIIDNTQFLSNVAFRQMEKGGVRAEGTTGMKATNVSCLNGEYGWYFGEAPLGSNARLIRFLHLTNCFSDTNTLYGWRFARGAMSKIRDVKMVNCWAGSVSGTDAPAVFINGMENSTIVGGVYVLARSNIIDISNSNDMTISIIGYEYNWGDNSHSGIKATSCERLTFNSCSLRPIEGSTNTAHSIELNSCLECSIVGGTFEEYDGVLLNNSSRVTCSSFSMGGGGVPVEESGNSNFNVIGMLTATSEEITVGSSTCVLPSSGTSNPKLKAVGGSPTSPSYTWVSSQSSGIYRYDGSGGLGYSVGGVPAFIIRGTNSETITKALRPVSDNAHNLGSAPQRWAEIFAVNGVINTSDENYKRFEDIGAAERECAAAIKLAIKKFKWIEAINKKGDDARYHYGVSAQEVAKIFKAHGLNPNNYSLFCYDEWGEEFHEDTGELINTSGSRYGIRYTELLCFIMCSM